MVRQRPWKKYGGRSRANERKDTSKARNAASCKSVTVAAGSSETVPSIKESIAMTIKRLSTFDLHGSDFKAPAC